MTESNKTKKKSIMVIVGDVSADRHTASIIRKLNQSLDDLSIWGVGGSQMKKAGVELIYNMDDFAAVGIVELFKFYPRFFRMGADLVRQMKERKPDLVFLVDFGTFNLNAAQYIRRSNPQLPIVYFISPQVWASRPWRIATVKRTISKMLVIFPFEETLYRNKGVAARFVGHPLLQQIPQDKELPCREDICQNLGLNPDAPVISVFPGSHKQEILEHAPVLIQSIRTLIEERSDLQFVISLASEKLSRLMRAAIDRSELKGCLGKNVFLTESDKNYQLMKCADLLWTKSGTTTLEAAMFAKPMLIYYRGNWLSFFLVMLHKRVKYAGLPNILSPKALLPELLQLDCRAQQLVRYTRDLLDVPGLRKEMTDRLANIRDQLGTGNYVNNCAEELLKHLHPSHSAPEGSQ